MPCLCSPFPPFFSNRQRMEQSAAPNKLGPIALTTVDASFQFGKNFSRTLHFPPRAACEESYFIFPSPHPFLLVLCVSEKESLGELTSGRKCGFFFSQVAGFEEGEEQS